MLAEVERGIVRCFREGGGLSYADYPALLEMAANGTALDAGQEALVIRLRATLDRLTVGRARDARLLVGPRGGVITTATLRDATGWDELVNELGLAGLVRHGLRHTALTWMADAGVELHLLQRVAGHQDPAVTSRYLHPDAPGRARCRGSVLALVGPKLGRIPGAEASRGWAGGRMNAV